MYYYSCQYLYFIAAFSIFIDTYTLYSYIVNWRYFLYYNDLYRYYDSETSPPSRVILSVHFGTYLECNSTTPGLGGCVSKAGYYMFETWHQELDCLPPTQGALGLQLAHSNFLMNVQQGCMQDQIIASHTYFGAYMDVSCEASL